MPDVRASDPGAFPAFAVLGFTSEFVHGRELGDGMPWPSRIVGPCCYKADFVTAVRVEGRARGRCLRSDPLP